MHPEPTENQRQAGIRQNQELAKTFSRAETESKRWLCTIQCWRDKVEATYVPVPGSPDAFRVESLRCPDCGAVTLAG
jgi:hypothetical protein